MLIDCHVHLLPARRLQGLMKWMHRFYPEHPVPMDVTLGECLAHYDALPVDYVFNLVYPLRHDETEDINRFNVELHRRHPWVIPFGGLHVEDADKGAIVDRCLGDRHRPPRRDGHPGGDLPGAGPRRAARDGARAAGRRDRQAVHRPLLARLRFARRKTSQMIAAVRMRTSPVAVPAARGLQPASRNAR